jgi:hypothetical protein
LINPKVSIYIREDSNDKSNRSGSLSPTPQGYSSNGTHHIPRKRNHASACE